MIQNSDPLSGQEVRFPWPGMTVQGHRAGGSVTNTQRPAAPVFTHLRPSAAVMMSKLFATGKSTLSSSFDVLSGKYFTYNERFFSLPEIKWRWWRCWSNKSGGHQGQVQSHRHKAPMTSKE